MWWSETERLCMAWNPNSSPWDWDSGGFFTTTHGHGESNELQKSTVNKHTTTSTSFLDGYGFSSHRNKNSGHSDPNPGMITSSIAKDDPDSDMNGIVSSNGHGIERIPILTTCIGGNGYFVDSSSDGHGGSAIHGRFHDNWDGIGQSLSLDKTLTHNVNQRNSLKGGASKAMHVIADTEQGHLYSDVKNHIKSCLDKTIANYVVNQRNGLSDNEDDSKMMLDAKQYIPLHSGINSSNILKIGSHEDQYSSTATATATGSGGSVDSLTGLHLGKKSYSQDVCPDLSVKPKPKAHRKSRIGLAKLQVPCCQVEGCKLDLTSAKDYHRRHKVCEVHSKSVKVVVSSLEQRFCQQCSRFHVLAEFDEAKRSCRRRLAGHNKRRRKPQPFPLELQARVHSRFEDCDFLQHPRFPRMTLWQDPWDYRTGMMLPQYENQLTYNNYAWQVPSMERQVYMDGISPSIPHDKLPLLLLQTSKQMIEANVSHPTDHHLQQKQQNHLLPPVSNGLTLASSSSSLSQLGPGLFSGTEIIPVTTCLQPRVTDSGRALSLLSLQTHDSHNLIDHHLLLHNHHQIVHHDEGMAPHQHCNDLSVESMMMSSLASSSHMPSSGATGLEKGLYGCPYVHDLNTCDFESENQSMMGTQMQGHDNSKKTQDLMRMSSFALDAATATAAAGHGQSVAAAFQLESSSLGDLQCSYGISYL